MSQQEKSSNQKCPIKAYERCNEEQVNNPPAGRVTPETDPDTGQHKKTYAYDPHLDPQLTWAGKAEHTSFYAYCAFGRWHFRVATSPKMIYDVIQRCAPLRPA